MVIMMVTSRREKWNRSQRSLGTMKPQPARKAGQAGLGVHQVDWIGGSERKAHLGEGTLRDGWRAKEQETL